VFSVTVTVPIKTFFFVRSSAVQPKIILYYNDLVFQPSAAFLFKDFGQVPFVTAELNGANLEYWISAATPSVGFDCFRGKLVRQFAKRYARLPRRIDVLKNAELYRAIDDDQTVTHLIIFPFTPWTDLIVARRAARRGIKIIVKLDTNRTYLETLADDWRRTRRRAMCFFRQSQHYRELLQIADLVVCETTECEAILLDRFLGLTLAPKLVKTFSGLSESWMNAIDVIPTTSTTRRNAIIVSGRISSWQKNSELIFKAGPPPDGWTIEFVGEIDGSMAALIERYRALNPEFDQYYRFYGAINDKRAYFDLLMQAKALLMNSRGGEGFSNVYAEAHFCRLYLVTSDVSGAVDATENGRSGLIYRRDDADALRRALAEIPARVSAAHGAPASEPHRRNFIWEYSLDRPEIRRLFRPLATVNAEAAL
jgi:glycosyltransferase involved in cell wall biosynthesis